jgi:hypothetical protein
MKTFCRANLTFMLILAFESAFAGNEVRNGGGLAEMNFALALIRLRPTMLICVTEPRCQLNSIESSLAASIAEELAQLSNFEKTLVFENQSADNGTRFLLHGQVRIAFTGDHARSPIHINKDMIYLNQSKESLTEAISVATAMAILSHEFGHHQGIKDHTVLDLFGAKISMEYARRQQTISYSGSQIQPENFATLSVENFDINTVSTSTSEFERPHVVFASSAGHLEMSPEIDQEITRRLNDQARTRRLKCGHTPGARLLGYRLVNVHWSSNPLRDDYFEPGIAKVNFNVGMNVEYKCADWEGPKWMDSSVFLQANIAIFEHSVTGDTTDIELPPITLEKVSSIEVN